MKAVIQLRNESPGIQPKSLQATLARPGIEIVPGVVDALTARLAEETGFRALFVTGAGIANSRFGFPDLGLVTLTETVDVVRRVAAAVAIPVLADADTGYGNHLNVMRTVTELEAAGASGIILEDQVFPKKCGHFNDKEVVPVEEMVAKLRVAGLARRSDALVIVARTDALAIEGFDAALARAATYIDAGADVIFVEAPTSVDQLEAIPKMLEAPCLVNMVEGGQTPMLTVGQLEALGYKIALYANLALRTAAQSVREAFVTLRRDGTSEGIVPKMISWDDRQRLVRLSWWEELGRGV